MKIIITYIISLFLFLSCKREINNFEMRKEITGFKLDCSKNPLMTKYIYSSRKSEDGNWRKEVRSKKGRVQCGEEYFDFNAVYSDGNKRAYIDVTYKQKTTRLAEISLTEKSNSLVSFEPDLLSLDWQETEEVCHRRCLFSYRDGIVSCERL